MINLDLGSTRKKADKIFEFNRDTSKSDVHKPKEEQKASAKKTNGVYITFYPGRQLLLMKLKS